MIRGDVDVSILSDEPRLHNRILSNISMYFDYYWIQL